VAAKRTDEGRRVQSAQAVPPTTLTLSRKDDGWRRRALKPSPTGSGARRLPFSRWEKVAAKRTDEGRRAQSAQAVAPTALTLSRKDDG